MKIVLSVILNKGERVIFLSFIFYNFFVVIFYFYVNHSGEESIIAEMCVIGSRLVVNVT